jgi:N-acetylglucosaminyl-diphospho-decaprenol L-rhamnosyltransferase
MSFTGSIILVNFNSGSHLASSLDSIGMHAPEARTFVVDNASSDGSERAAKEFGDGVRLIRNRENVGFARAVNQALREPGLEEFILLLNPDCRLQKGTLDRLAWELTAHPDCAIAAPQVLDEDGSIQGNARGDPNMMTGLFGRTTLLSRLFPDSSLARRNVQRDPESDQESREVDWVSGACLLARRDALKQVGGFDERYFLYWEDADLCRRLRARGFTVRHVASVFVTHAAGGSSRAVPALAVREFHRSAFTYYATHEAKTWPTRTLGRLMLAARCRWKLLGLPRNGL